METSMMEKLNKAYGLDRDRILIKQEITIQAILR